MLVQDSIFFTCSSLLFFLGGTWNNLWSSTPIPRSRSHPPGGVFQTITMTLVTHMLGFYVSDGQSSQRASSMGRRGTREYPSHWGMNNSRHSSARMISCASWREDMIGCYSTSLRNCLMSVRTGGGVPSMACGNDTSR
jgi:hypothetical protein